MKKKINITLLICLFVVSLESTAKFGEPYRLNANLVANGDVTEFVILPETGQAVYVADQEQSGLFGVYLVSLEPGGTPVRLNDNLLTSEAQFNNIDISSNGIFVTAVISDPGTGGQSTIVAPVIGTPLEGISITLNTDGFRSFDFSLSDGSDIQQSKDGKRLVYLYDDDGDGVHDLFSLRLKPGSEPIKLNSSLPSSGVIFEFRLSADSARVVYRGDAETNNVNELFSVPINGSSAPVKLTPPPMPLTDVALYALSADSQRVVYTSDQVVNERFDLFSTPIDSSNPIKLNGSFAAGGSDVVGVLISPDGQTVVYRADQDVNNSFEIYKVPILGGDDSRINSNSFAAQTQIKQFEISNDGSRVVYSGNLSTVDATGLYSRDLNILEAETKISPDSGGQVESFRLSASGESVAYVGNLDTLNKVELYSAPSNGGVVTKLNNVIPSNSAIQLNYQISPDGKRVIFLAPTIDRNYFDLFSADIKTGARQMLSANSISRNGVTDFTLSASGEHLLYLSDQLTAAKSELFAVQLIDEIDTDQLCLPIKTAGNKLVIICL